MSDIPIIAGYGVKRAHGAGWFSIFWGWLLWTGWSLAAGLVALILALAISAALPPGSAHRAFEWMLQGPAGIVPGHAGVEEIVSLAVALACVGAYFGTLQRGLLQFFGIRARGWVWTVVVASALGAPATYVLGLLAAAIGSPMSWVQLGPVSVTLVSIGLWLFACREMSNARWLLPAAAIAWLVPTRSVIGVYILGLGPAMGLAATTLLSQPGDPSARKFAVPSLLQRPLPVALACAALVLGLVAQRPLATNVQLASVTTSSASGSAALPAPSAGSSVVVGQSEYRLAGDEIQIVDLAGGTETRRFRVRSGAPGVSLEKIVAVGDRAFVLGAHGMVMWKLDLKQPHDLSENDLFKAEAPVDIAAGERYLYVMSRAPYPYYTLNVLDDFDAPRPNVHGFFEIGEQPDGFASAGDTIYVLRDGELQTYRAG